jgi:hypothetical protein
MNLCIWINGIGTFINPNLQAPLVPESWSRFRQTRDRQGIPIDRGSQFGSEDPVEPSTNQGIERTASYDQVQHFVISQSFPEIQRGPPQRHTNGDFLAENPAICYNLRIKLREINVM